MGVQVIAVVVTIYLAGLSLNCCEGASCISQQFAALDEQCSPNGIDTLSGNDTEARDSFCNGPCAQNLAQAFFNCDFDHAADVIQQGCIKDENGRFCQDFLRDNHAFDNITNACVRDRDCVGGCGDAVQEFGCCVSHHNTIPTIFSSCDSMGYFVRCELPFILGPRSTLAPSTSETELFPTGLPPVGTPDPNVHPLLSCLSDKYTNDRALQICLLALQVEDPMDTTIDTLLDQNVPAFCESECSQTLARAYFDCESKFGSFFQFTPETGLGNFSLGELLQNGCAKDGNSQFCIQNVEDPGFLEQTQDVLNGSCQTVSDDDCSLPNCRESVASLGCCVHFLAQLYPLLDDSGSLLESCNVQACAVPFKLDESDGDSVTPMNMAIQFQCASLTVATSLIASAICSVLL